MNVEKEGDGQETNPGVFAIPIVGRFDFNEFGHLIGNLRHSSEPGPVISQTQPFGWKQ